MLLAPATQQFPFTPSLQDKPHFLVAEVSKMGAWMTADVQLDRAGERISQTTFKGQYSKLTWQLMGFCNSFLDIPVSQLSLSLFMQPLVLTSYFSFMQARGMAASSLNNITSRIKKVLTYLASPTAGKQLINPKPLKAWLANMGSQLSKAITKKRPPPEEPTPMPTLGEWVGWVDSLVEPLVSKLSSLEDPR